MSLTKVSFSLINGAPANVLDFGAVGDGTTDCTAAFTAALASVASSYGEVYVPQGTYLITDAGATGFTVPVRSNIVFSPGAVINYNGTATSIFNVKNGTQFIGNGVKINITNAAWDGTAILFDGVNRYADDYPCAIDGVNILGNDITKGTGLGLTATNATNFISFVRFSNFTFNNLNFGLTLNCGSSGSSGDSSTWHWINGNVFENFNFYGTRNGVNIAGLPVVPAEVAGNIFNNFEFQVGTSASHFPIYCYGGSFNVFNNYFIWDWNVATANPVQFAGGAVDNQCSGNIDPVYVTHNGVNSVYHNGAGLYTSITADGDIFARGISSLKVGYAGYEATITNGGAGPLIISPGAGYGIEFGSAIAPHVDNSYSCGSSGKRWSVVYAATGTINTSDETQKQQFASLTEAEQSTAQAIKGLIKTFKFNDAVEQKGDKARIHVGVSAQSVKAAFEANGLDADKYGLFCSDTWYELDGKLYDDEGKPCTENTPNAVKVTRLGVRYEELLAFVIAAL